jgi:hypothetical protein
VQPGERQLGLRLDPGGAQHAGRRRLDGRPQQRGLADPRLAGDHEHAGPLREREDLRKLGIAPHQHSGGQDTRP